MEKKREEENRSDDARESNSQTPEAHSVSRAEPGVQAERASPERDTKSASSEADAISLIRGDREPSAIAHIVLYQPEIPQNTGNIGRTCVATGASLWIVRPAAFRLDDASLRRAGLDYWQYVDLHIVAHWAELRERLPESDRRRYWYFSRFAQRTLWDADPGRGDGLVFGSETSGLPSSLREGAGNRAVRLPTSNRVRSLNLATTVGVAVYDIVRRG